MTGLLVLGLGGIGLQQHLRQDQQRLLLAFGR
jgi:hypothetical protein